MALTDEDKSWISERLQGVESRLLRAFRNFARRIELVEEGGTTDDTKP